MKNFYFMEETLSDLREDVMLLRYCLRGLLEDAEGQGEKELQCLWRLSDYLEQHVGDVERMLLG